MDALPDIVKIPGVKSVRILKGKHSFAESIFTAPEPQIAREDNKKTLKKHEIFKSAKAGDTPSLSADGLPNVAQEQRVDVIIRMSPAFEREDSASSGVLINNLYSKGLRDYSLNEYRKKGIIRGKLSLQYFDQVRAIEGIESVNRLKKKWITEASKRDESSL